MAIFRICLSNISARRYQSIRSLSSLSVDKRGLVLGIYCNKNSKELSFTSFAKKYNESTSGKLLEQINMAGPIKGGGVRLFWGLGTYETVAVAGLGDESTWDNLEGINGCKENVRNAAAAGAKALLNEKITNIDIESLECAQSAAEGALLCVHKFQVYKSESARTPESILKFAEPSGSVEDWNRGIVLAKAQNWARILMETPANLMTPTIFAETVKSKLSKLGNVEVTAHDKKWAEEQKMGSYLSVSKGSVEPPIFLEISYMGAENKADPMRCLIGKGITFDSGGISLKPASKMDEMRADMGGGACVSATIYALATLKVPLNVKCLIPLCENLPSGTANKPGDIVHAMNGKSICIDNTDCEGRLVLCDAICYSEKFKPKYIMDVATLTGAMSVTLGDCVCGGFTNNNQLWDILNRAGSESGDRVWRMPLYKHYSSEITGESLGYDVNNLSRLKGGGSCTAAAFLHQFIPKNTSWIHIDMCNLMANCTDQSYIGTTGMTGRPMRTIFEFVCREAGLII